jgi:phage/plasmid-like protein (TIGR03299 family)
MSHEVETMFYTGDVPWHRLGTHIEEAPTAQDALSAAGLDWTVMAAPLYGGIAEQYVAVEGWVANVRSTDHRVLGVVSDRYQIVQNAQAFDWVDELLGFGVRFETAGSLQGGKRIWMTTKLPDQYRIAGDAVDVYLTVTNGHDGRHAVTAVVSPVRVVCQNTLNLALGSAERSWSLAHYRHIDQRLDEARTTLQLTTGYLAKLDAVANQLLTIPVANADWRDLVYDLVPQSPHELPSTTARRDLLMAAWSLPDQAAFMDTAWNAVNAVAWMSSHTVPRNPERAMINFIDGDDWLNRTMKRFAPDIPVDDPTGTEVEV